MGLIYLVILSIFLYFLFHNFNFEDISSIKVIHSNQDQLKILKENIMNDYYIICLRLSMSVISNELIVNSNASAKKVMH